MPAVVAWLAGSPACLCSEARALVCGCMACAVKLAWLLPGLASTPSKLDTTLKCEGLAVVPMSLAGPTTPAAASIARTKDTPHIVNTQINTLPHVGNGEHHTQNTTKTAADTCCDCDLCTHCHILHPSSPLPPESRVQGGSFTHPADCIRCRDKRAQHTDECAVPHIIAASE